MSKIISLIASCKARPAFLYYFIESYLNYTHDLDKTELCLHMDGAPDASVELAERYKKYNQKNISLSIGKGNGQSYGLNRCLEMAKGEYLYWVCDDYILPPNWDEKAIPYLKENFYISIDQIEPGFGSFPPFHPEIGNSPETFSIMSFNHAVKNRENEIKDEVGFVFGSGLFSTEKVKKIGGWPEDFDPYTANDIAFVTLMHRVYPELIFYKSKNISVFHFQYGAVRDNPDIKEAAKDAVLRYERRFNCTFDQTLKDIKEQSEKNWIKYNFWSILGKTYD